MHGYVPKNRSRRASLFLLVFLTCAIAFSSLVSGQQVPTVKVTDVKHPAQVAPGAHLTVNVTIRYDFNTWILADVGIQDTTNGTMLQSRRIILDKPETRIYALQLKAPVETGPWALVASTRCWCSNTWIQHPTLGNQSFTIEIIQQPVQLDLFVPNFLSQVKIDNEIRAVNGGVLRVETSPGLHSISAPAVVYEAENTRWVFESWSSGATAPLTTIALSSDAELHVKYVRQHRVSASSNLGSVIGSGWYDEGSTAKLIALPSSSAPQPLLGFGEETTFIGWKGDVVSDQEEIAVVVISPIVLEAAWNVDSGNSDILIVLPLADSALAAILVLQLGRRRKTADKSSLDVQSVRSLRLTKAPMLIVLIGLSLLTFPHGVYADEDTISAGGAEWYFWQDVPSDTCIIWMSGGLIFADHQKINPYFLESYNTIRFLQDLRSQYCVVALRSGTDNLVQPSANRTLHTQSYYSASAFIGEIAKQLINRGYSNIFLAGFSIGGVVAAHEVTVRNPDLWSTPNGVILISSPLSATVIGRATGLRSNILVVYGDTALPVFRESGRRYFENAPEGRRAEGWQNKEFYVLEDVDHEIWTRDSDGNYDPRAFWLITAFIERTKSLQLQERLGSALTPCGNLIGSVQVAVPEHVPLLGVYDVLVDLPAVNSSSAIDVVAVDLEEGSVLSVQRWRHRNVQGLVRLVLFENRTISKFISIGIALSLDNGDFCQLTRTAVNVRNPAVSVGLPYEQAWVSFDGKTYLARDQPARVLQLEVNPRVHTLRVPINIDIGNNTRAVFLGWSDGDNRPMRSIAVFDDVRLEAVYAIQYQVYVSMEAAVHPGGPWVDQGTMMRYSPQTLRRAGQDGNGTVFFERWTFNATGGDAAGISELSSPAEFSAIFMSISERERNNVSVYALVYVLVGLLVLLALCNLGLYYRRLRKVHNVDSRHYDDDA